MRSSPRAATAITAQASKIASRAETPDVPILFFMTELVYHIPAWLARVLLLQKFLPRGPRFAKLPMLCRAMVLASAEGNLALGSLRAQSTRASKEEQMKRLAIFAVVLAAVVFSGCKKDDNREILKENPVKKNAEQAAKTQEAIDNLTK